MYPCAEKVGRNSTKQVDAPSVHEPLILNLSCTTSPIHFLPWIPITSLIINWPMQMMWCNSEWLTAVNSSWSSRHTVNSESTSVHKSQLELGLPTLDLGIPGFPPLPSPLSSLLPFPRGPHPLNQLGVWGSAISSTSGVWGEARADKRFGAYLSQKEQLWWQQFLCIFIRINLNFCTNTSHVSNLTFLDCHSHCDNCVFWLCTALL